MTARIIGLSGKARHGKNSTALFLKELLAPRGLVVREIGFADGVKEEARSLGWNGEKDAKGRTLLQQIGQTRRAVDPLYWVNLAFAKIAAQEGDDVVWVITDVRYRNEADAIRARGGMVWRVERVLRGGAPYENDLTPEQRAHPSETDLDGYPLFATILVADTLDHLREDVDAEIARWLTRW